MKYRPLGTSDVNVSTIALGCWAFVDEANWGSQEKEDTIAAIQTALDEGINFFDTAEAYGDGRAEELLGEALGGRRDDAIIATKVVSGKLSRNDVLNACERSLKRLSTDVIDLYQIHWPYHETPLEETLAAMDELKQAGKIRMIGVSNFFDRDLTESTSLTGIMTNQMPYSLVWRAVEHRCQPLCVDQDVSIICYSPLMHGLLNGKFRSTDDLPVARRRTRLFSKDHPQAIHGEKGAEKEAFEALDRIREICSEAGVEMGQAALAWLLTRPATDSAIVGARNADQVRQNAAAGDLDLGEDVIDQLTEATDALKEKIGLYPDPWRGTSFGRMR
jgi:aryl-alcohol dehydrogenase-like predicted oxidoreductase